MPYMDFVMEFINPLATMLVDARSGRAASLTTGLALVLLFALTGHSAQRMRWGWRGFVPIALQVLAMLNEGLFSFLVGRGGEGTSASETNLMLSLNIQLGVIAWLLLATLSLHRAQKGSEPSLPRS